MNDKTAILAAEQAWLDAHLRMDIPRIESLMHRDYFRVQPDGSLWDKARTLASYQSGQREWFDARVDQLDVRIYGNTAVVVGRWQARGVNHGEHFDYAARYVSVWVLEDGTWQMVSDQSTEIVE